MKKAIKNIFLIFVFLFPTVLMLVVLKGLSFGGGQILTPFVFMWKHPLPSLNIYMNLFNVLIWSFILYVIFFILFYTFKKVQNKSSRHD